MRHSMHDVSGDCGVDVSIHGSFAVMEPNYNTGMGNLELPKM